jgi:predicted RNase H-like HicB family nuclease
MEYAVIYEPGPNNWSAYAPDFPGCVSTGKTLEGCKQSFVGALALHIKGMREDNEPIPEPQVVVGLVAA